MVSKTNWIKLERHGKTFLWTTSLPGPTAESGRKFQPGEASPGELPGELPANSQ